MADSEALNSYFAVVSPKWRIGLSLFVADLPIKPMA